LNRIELHPKPPFDFVKMLQRLEKTRGGLVKIEDSRLIRAIRIAGRTFLFQLEAEAGEDGQTTVRALSLNGEIDPTVVQSAREKLARMLSINVDLQAFYDHLDRIPALAPLQNKFHGLRLLLEPDLFQCLIRTIIGQQLNLGFAATLTGRLVQAAANDPIRYNGDEYYAFPSAEQVAVLSIEQLRELQFSQRKAEYVIGLAQAVAEGSLDLEQLESLDNEDVIQKLIKYRGVGRWTVECFLLFGMGREDLLPAADIGLRNAIKLWYGLGDQPTEEEVRRWGASWSPWSSYITYYLWESLNQQ
jgi:DNA-3-methyladenine glycosylase II